MQDNLRAVRCLLQSQSFGFRLGARQLSRIHTGSALSTIGKFSRGFPFQMPAGDAYLRQGGLTYGKGS